MQSLQIEATETSPKVDFSPLTNVFEIVGESRPENAREFYLPIMSWLDEYVSIAPSQAKKDVIFKFDLDYMNSISMKFLFEILRKAEAIKTAGCNTKIQWYFNRRDEDIKENGEEFATLLTIPF